MTATAVEARPNPSLTSPDDQQTFETQVRAKLTEADQYRRQFVPQWQLNLAFVAGQQWAVIDRRTRQLRDVRDVDPRYVEADLVVADIIHENRGAALGELQTDSDRPQLILPGDGTEDAETEGIARDANRLLGYGWDYEWHGDDALDIARQYCVDLGVSAIRCRYDQDGGPPVKASDGQQVQAPMQNGRPILNPEDARAYVANTAAQGHTAKLTPLSEGLICWEPGTAFNILVPQGIPHESRFPWECWVSVVPLADLKGMYPAAASLKPDGDIGSAIGIVSAQTVVTPRTEQGIARVRDSCWVFTYYQAATPAFPKGRVAVLASSQKKLLAVTNELPYQTQDGRWHSGIRYLHWQRLTDRFYSRSLIDALRDPQRMRNRVETQKQEIGDRSMPKTFVQEGALPQKPLGVPGEYIELKQGSPQPVFANDGGPADWMWKQAETILDNAAHASTLSALKLGDNPTQVSTYSQLALLFEQEASKRSSIRADQQNQIAKLTEFSMLDIRRYWRPGKRVLLAGEQNELQAAEYEQSMLPESAVVKVAKGSPRPRSQAAQLQLIQDIWDAAVACGATVQDPEGWMRWYYQSLEAGEPLPLPKAPADTWADKAELENRAAEHGPVQTLTYYDPAATHIPIHRRGQDEALMAYSLDGDPAHMRKWQWLEQHIQDHLAVSAQNQGALPPPAPQPGASSPPQLLPPPDTGSEPPPAGSPVPGLQTT